MNAVTKSNNGGPAHASTKAARPIDKMVEAFTLGFGLSAAAADATAGLLPLLMDGERVRSAKKEIYSSYVIMSTLLVLIYFVDSQR